MNEDGDKPCLGTDRSSVFLDADRLDVDLPHVAHITAKDVRALSSSGLEMLAAGFRGRFLEGLELPRCPVFEAWRTFHADALDRTRSLILRALVERLRSEPERALPYVQALPSMDPSDVHDVVGNEIARHFGSTERDATAIGERRVGAT